MLQIDARDDDCGAQRVHIGRVFFCPFGAFWTGQQMFFQRRELGFVRNHAEVIALQIVVRKVVHDFIVERGPKDSQNLLRAPSRV